MASVTIWHNPRCSKSRQTLSLLEEHGAAPTIVEYLKTPPTAKEIVEVTKKLGLPMQALLRAKEQAFKEMGLDAATMDDAELAALLAANPALIERPVVVVGGKAAIGRPPESVLPLLD